MGQRKGNMEPIPRQRGDNGQVNIGAKQLLERPEHLSTESRGEETVGASEQGASKQASNRAKNSVSLAISEQYPAASPPKDQIQIVQGTTSSILHELLVISLELR